MEFQRFVLCLAMLTACVLAVESAAIEPQPSAVLPAEQTNPAGSAAEPQPAAEHQREKKWAFYTPYSAYPYGVYPYPSAYSALPYYQPHFRSLPYYSPYIL